MLADSPLPPHAVDDRFSKFLSAAMGSSAAGQLPMAPPRNAVERFTDRVRLEYYRYEVTFGLYVMTPAEKLVANTFVFVVLSLLFWALVLYFPALLYQKLSRLVWLLTGHSGEEMGAVLGILDSHVDSMSIPFSSQNGWSP
ncbi:hypothetical protein PHISP_08416 [Aspergillus sp. HF37]|nr:hypothetical protein PHISP_08416 [Aspergillus sp. HF37]